MSEDSPLQSSPPFFGIGLVHCLSRSLIPGPQDALQGVNSLHSVKFPWIAMEVNPIIISIRILQKWQATNGSAFSK